MISAAISVSVCVLAIMSGMKAEAPPASDCAAEITMYEILKPAQRDRADHDAHRARRGIHRQRVLGAGLEGLVQVAQAGAGTD